MRFMGNAHEDISVKMYWFHNTYVDIVCDILFSPTHPMATKDTGSAYFTAEEMKLLKTLPKATQDYFKGRVQPETLDTFETEEELVERMKSASYDKYPEVRQMVGELAKTGDVSAVSFEKMSDGALDTLLFSIGACGMSALIETSLQENVDASAADAIVSLSKARHRVLTVNSSGKT